jgi:predicted phosphohydrolase
MGTNQEPIPASRSSTTLRVVLLSDTHELHREVEVPDGDILIHAGDFTMFSKSMSAIADFNTWLGELPHRQKVLIFGNHEFFAEADPSKRSMLTNAVVLINEGTEIEGLRIWGSPVTPLYGGAFGLSSAEDRRQLYAQIPEDTDILVTHGPPFGILDSAPHSGIHSGCS